jgi:hypothetical protein
MSFSHRLGTGVCLAVFALVFGYSSADAFGFTLAITAAGVCARSLKGRGHKDRRYTRGMIAL